MDHCAWHYLFRPHMQLPESSIEYRGKKYCKVCKSYWVDKQMATDRQAAQFPKSLREMLKAKRTTQKELAHKIDVSPMTMSRYCSLTNPKAPSFEIFLRICAALNVTPQALTGARDYELEQAKVEIEGLQRQVRVFSTALVKLGAYPEKILEDWHRNHDY